MGSGVCSYRHSRASGNPVTGKACKATTPDEPDWMPVFTRRQVQRGNDIRQSGRPA